MTNTFIRIEILLAEAQALPNPDPKDLWDENSDKLAIVGFFTHLRAGMIHLPVLQAVENSDLSGDVRTVYRRLNAPTHSVRNQLILLSIDPL